jgi:hypothetical protein
MLRTIAPTNPTTAPKMMLRPSHPGLEFSGVGGGHVLSKAVALPYATRIANRSRADSRKTRRGHRTPEGKRIGSFRGRGVGERPASPQNQGREAATSLPRITATASRRV